MTERTLIPISLLKGCKKDRVESEHFRFKFYGDPDVRKLKLLIAAGARIEQISSGEGT